MAWDDCLMARGSRFLAVGVLIGAGCGVERIPAGEPDAGVVPAEVQAVFDESCSCHTVAGQAPMLDRAGSYIGTQIVVPGDLQVSQLAVQITEGLMPPPGSGYELTPEGRYIVFGWIADGAQLVVEDEVDGSTGGPGAATQGASSSETGSDPATGGTGTTSGAPDFVEFVPVLEILEARCGGPTCHRDGGVTPPVMEDAVAYDNLVGVESAVVDGAIYVVPENPAASHVVTRITSPGMPMPPPTATALTPEQVDTIVAWIEAGAQR